MNQFTYKTSGKVDIKFMRFGRIKIMSKDPLVLVENDLRRGRRPKSKENGNTTVEIAPIPTINNTAELNNLVQEKPQLDEIENTIQNIVVPPVEPVAEVNIFKGDKILVNLNGIRIEATVYKTFDEDQEIGIILGTGEKLIIEAEKFIKKL
jgi:hypothetical protein